MLMCLCGCLMCVCGVCDLVCDVGRSVLIVRFVVLCACVHGLRCVYFVSVFVYLLSLCVPFMC